MGLRERDRDNPAAYWGPAVTRLCAHLDIQLPAPMTPEQEADFERRQDEADAEVLRLYGPDTAAA